MEMPDEIWMHVENGALSCHTQARGPASVAFVPLLRAVNADTRIRSLEAEVHGLQRALSFWHPGVPATGPSTIYDRAAADAFLLCGYDGPNEQSASDLGWITLNNSALEVGRCHLTLGLCAISFLVGVLFGIWAAR
jgi:hypothetical protein